MPLSNKNKSGYKGVVWLKNRNKWRARVCFNKQVYDIGFFDTALQASEAYDKYVIENNISYLLDKRSANRIYMNRYRDKHRDKHNCYRRNLRKENPLLYRAYEKSRMDKIREEIIKEYGGVCSCKGCGESTKEFLTLDHINNDGRQHRKDIKCQSGTSFYKWVKKNNFPKDNLRLMCYNCNCARGRCGYCPHEKIVYVG